MNARTIRSEIVDGDSISSTVIDLVKSVRDLEDTKLNPPLYDVIDPEALDDLFTSSETSGEYLGSTTFSYQGCRIAVSDR